MHLLLIDAYVKKVKQRMIEGDCPSTQSLSVETLEQVIEGLAKQVDDLKTSNLTLAQEAEQLRKENERLVRENEIYIERHKAWEACVYAVGLPVIKAVRDTEYGDAVPPIPVVNKITDLLDECFKLRKERDELADLLTVVKTAADVVIPHRDELQAKLDKVKWQPIDTCKPYTDVLMMFMSEGKYQKFQVASFIEWRGDRIYTDWPWVPQPTHWMPLPDAPERF